MVGNCMYMFNYVSHFPLNGSTFLGSTYGTTRRATFWLLSAAGPGGQVPSTGSHNRISGGSDTRSAIGRLDRAEPVAQPADVLVAPVFRVLERGTRMSSTSSRSRRSRSRWMALILLVTLTFAASSMSA